MIAVDRHGLLHVGRDALGSIERPAVARFERLLDIGRIGEMAALKVEGSRGWLCTAGRLLALDLRPGAAAVIGDIGLEGARALTVRGGRPVVATAAGLAFIDASNRRARWSSIFLMRRLKGLSYSRAARPILLRGSDFFVSIRMASRR